MVAGGMVVGKPRVVACIPAYNEERTIAGVVMVAQRYVDRVVVCDDGSTDLTGGLAGRLGCIVVRHGRKQGYGSALRTLLVKARELGADVAVTLDGDGQHDPGEIPALLKPVLKDDVYVAWFKRFCG